MKDARTFGCHVWYLKVGHDEDRRSNKFASRKAFGVFLGMAQELLGFLFLDPLRANLVVRTLCSFMTLWLSKTSGQASLGVI